jgi:hypothetical protein
MQKLHPDQRMRPRNAGPSDRILLLEAALPNATTENAELHRRNTELCAELERVGAENRRLRALLDEHGAVADPPPRAYAVREMTAGTCAGPRRRRSSEPQAPRGASTA